LATAALIAGFGAAATAMAQEPPAPPPPADGMMAGGPHGPMGGMMFGRMHGPGGTIAFAAIDTDGNGSLSRAELQAFAAARLAGADANGDGVLDRAEIIEALPGGHSPLLRVFSADPAEGMADRLLALVGATEAGQVDITVLADRRVNMLLATADEDRDAAISQAEADALAAGGRHGHHDHHRGGADDDDRGPQRSDG
jgi:hypothetical protein